jgi:hypothetical protein
MKKILITICSVSFAIILLVVTALSIKISKRTEQAKLIGQVLSVVDSEEEITNISGIEEILESRGMNLIEYTVVKENTNEVISQKSSGRNKLRFIFSNTTNSHGWSLASCTYIGKEGTFPVIVCDKSYNSKDSILRIEAIIK